jgi:hypothetical protein
MALIALALVLLPGLLVVRAPWTAIGPLSLAFWALGAWWPPFAGPGRSRILVASLAASLVLALLRLVPKHEVAPPPGWRPPPSPPPTARPGLPAPRLVSAPSLLVLVTALGLLAPVPLWQHAPGPRLAFQTTTSRLLLWRDGIPSSGEPLLPLEPVGAHAPALATLAADVSHVTGLDPGPALLWIVAVAAALVLVGLYAVHATWAPPRAAALGALVALAVSPWPGFLSAWGEGEALLALGFLLPAVALLVGHASRSSAVAAAMLLAAGSLAQPLLAAAAVALSWAVVLARRGSVRPAAARLMLCGLVALVLAAPGLWPLARALSGREALAIATTARTHELPPLALGLVLAAFAPFAFVQTPERRSKAARAAVAAVSVLAALLLILRVHGWFVSGQLGERTRAALSRAAQVTTPLESICAGERERDFVPALAGRPAGEPGVWIPAVYADEWARRERRPCRARLEDLVPRP